MRSRAYTRSTFALPYALLLAGLFAYAPGARAQARAFTHLSIDEGLSSSVVLDIEQDRRGLIWIGTDDGLNRYDGDAFVRVPRGREAIRGSVNGIAEDARGRIWIATSAGAGYLDRGTDDYHAVITGVRCSGVEALPGGRLLVVVRGGGVRIVDADSGEARALTSDNGLPSNQVLGSARGRDGRLWLLFPGGGLGWLDADAGRLVGFRTVGGAGAGGAYGSIAGGRPGRLWLLSDESLVEYDPGARAIVSTHGLPAGSGGGGGRLRTHFVAAGDGDELWIGTDRGALVYDAARDTWQHHLKGPTQHGINNDEVRSFLRDHEGSIWLGTYGGGVNLSTGSYPKFDHYRLGADGEPGGGGSIVSGFAEDAKGDLWITTWGDGLKVRRRDDGAHSSYRIGGGRFAREVFRSVTVDAAGALWLATDNNGLVRLAPRTGDYRHFRRGDRGLLSDDLYCAHYGAGSLWVGIGGGEPGLQRYRPGVGFETVRLRSPHDGQELRYVRAITDDGRGRLFLGTHGTGVWVYDTNTGAVEQYTSRDAGGGALSDDVVYALHYDSRGYLWVGTMTGGVNLVDLAARSAIAITEASGLPNACVNGILPGGPGELWLSTNGGLSRFAPPPSLFASGGEAADADARLLRGAFTNYTVADGLQSKEFKYGASYRGRDGRLYFGGVNGYNRFYPTEIPADLGVPRVVITDVLVFDREAWPESRSPPVAEPSGGEPPRIRLTHDQNLVTLDYTALDYGRAGRTHFAYYLEGFDDDWRYVAHARKASYTNLPPGEYTFRVRASRDGETWGGVGAAMSIAIVPPIWGELYVQLLGIAGVVGLLYGYYRRRLRAARDKARELDAAVQARTRDLATANERLRDKRAEIEAMWERIHDADQEKLRFYTDVSHELRTPLTLIIGPLEDVINGDVAPGGRGGALGIAQRNARRLLQLINDLLDLRTLEAGAPKLQLAPIDFVPFLREVLAHFEYELTLRSIGLETDLPEGLPMWADADKLETILFNVLGNAVKFAGTGGTIFVRAGADAAEGAMYVTVGNGGAYIPVDQIEHIFERFVRCAEHGVGRGNGIGLSLVKELVGLHDGSVEVTSGREVGTRFTVRLPLRSRVGDRAGGGTHERRGTLRPPAGPAPCPPATALRQSSHLRDADPMDVIETPTTDETQATVLVMEDDADMRTYLRSIFEPAFAVIEAADGYAALALARERVPDFILTDYMTPGLDGIGFCRALKADDTTSHIPVIMVTARTSDADYLAGLEVGIDDYITKPFSSRVLRLKVENILANRRAMWEHLRAREGVASAAATPTDRFYDRLYDEIEAHLGDEDFNTEALAKAMNMSRSQLYRKVLAVLGRPAGDLIRETRMTRARARLLATDEQVSTIAYALGFKSVSHFTKSFTAHAGVSPSRFRRQRQGVD